MKGHYLVAGQYTYTKEDCLGRGAWGSVYKAINKQGQVFALKKINKFQIQSSSDSYEKLQSEIRTLQHLSGNQHVIKFVDVFRTEGNYYIVTEYLEGSEDLLKHMNSRQKRFSELQARKLWKDLLLGVDYLHSRGVIHRDLKLQNILYIEKANQLKIIDFGLAVSLQSKQLSGSQVGSPLFMSPQVISSTKYSSKCDIWSLGVVFYYMLFAESPYGPAVTIKNIQQGMEKIAKGTFQLPKEKLMTPQSYDLIMKCLKYEEQGRPTAKQLLQMPIFNEKISYMQILEGTSQQFEYQVGFLQSGKQIK